MPNWAFGYVNVTGTRDGIKSFIERFVSEDDPSTIPGSVSLHGASSSRKDRHSLMRL